MQNSYLGGPTVLNSPSQVHVPKKRDKEVERLRGVARRAALTNDQREQANKKRRDTYHAKNADEKSARSERKREHNKTPSQREGRRTYNKRMKCLRDNNLHPESIAMENPHFTPELIFPDVDSTNISAHDWTIPVVNGTPVYVQPQTEQSMEIDTPSEHTSRLIHRHHVTHGERYALLRRRNRKFETTASTRTNEYVDEDINGLETPAQSMIINNGNTLFFKHPHNYS